MVDSTVWHYLINYNDIGLLFSRDTRDEDFSVEVDSQQSPPRSSLVHNSQREWITICWTTEATTRKLFHVSLVSFLTIIKCLNDTILFSFSWPLFEKRRRRNWIKIRRGLFSRQTTLGIPFFLFYWRKE